MVFTTGVTNTGLYPYFTCPHGAPYTIAHCEAINGGSPQLANLSAHLIKWAQDVKIIVPDPDSETIVALDWEVWWPSWEENDVGSGELCDPVHGKCNTNQSHVHACKYCHYCEPANALAVTASPRGRPDAERCNGCDRSLRGRGAGPGAQGQPGGNRGTDRSRGKKRLGEHDAAVAAADDRARQAPPAQGHLSVSPPSPPPPALAERRVG